MLRDYGPDVELDIFMGVPVSRIASRLSQLCCSPLEKDWAVELRHANGYEGGGSEDPDCFNVFCPAPPQALIHCQCCSDDYASVSEVDLR